MIRVLLLCTGILATQLLTGCDNKPAAGAGPGLSAVTVSRPLQQKITEWDEYTGRFVAVETVEIRARVSGFIDSIHFQDGQIVKQGDLLFVIDPRPYQPRRRAGEGRRGARARQAGNRYLRRRAGDAAGAQPDRHRAGVRHQEIDATATLSAAVMSAEAALKQAQLNLEWTEVRAPIAGRISDRRVDAGNLITGGQTGATLLTSIVSIDPIHFVFDGSEADFMRYLRLAAAGVRPSSRDVQNPVAVRLADESDYKHHGRMDFVDNVVNAKTGTIRGRAIFDNKDGLLTPGFFGRLRLFGGEHDALLLPDSAIASDQSSKIVFTVADDGTVGIKRVELGPIVDGLRVIRSGLTADRPHRHRRTGARAAGSEGQGRGRQDRSPRSIIQKSGASGCRDDTDAIFTFLRRSADFCRGSFRSS